MCWSARWRCWRWPSWSCSAPLIFKATGPMCRRSQPLGSPLHIARFGVGGIVLVVALFILHMWLPAGRRRLAESGRASWRPWCCGSLRHHLRPLSRRFAYTYVTYYAGLASAMIALVFLYYSAWIFIFGGELNAAIARVTRRREPADVAAVKPQTRLDCRVSSGGRRRLDHVVEITQPQARRVDQHRHIARLVPVSAHQLVGVRNLLPRGIRRSCMDRCGDP